MKKYLFYQIKSEIRSKNILEFVKKKIFLTCTLHVRCTVMDILLVYSASRSTPVHTDMYRSCIVHGMYNEHHIPCSGRDPRTILGLTSCYIIYFTFLTLIQQFDLCHNSLRSWTHLALVSPGWSVCLFESNKRQYVWTDWA